MQISIPLTLFFVLFSFASASYSPRFNFSSIAQQGGHGEFTSFAAFAGVKQASHSFARSKAVSDVDPSTYKDLWGTWDGTVSFVPSSNGKCSTSPRSCDTIVAIAGTSLNITLDCPTIPLYSILLTKITGYTQNQITIQDSEGEYCLTWNGQGNQATMVMDLKAGSTCPASTTPLCSASHQTFVYTMTQLDLSNLQGTWSGSETGIVRNGTCQPEKCKATWVVQGSYITISENCGGETTSVSLIINGITPGNVQTYMEYTYEGKTLIIRICWAYSQDSKAMWNVNLGYDTSTLTTFACPTYPIRTNCNTDKSQIFLFDMECKSGCKYKAPKKGLSVGAKVAISFVVILVVAGAGAAAVFFYMRRRQTTSSNRKYIQHAEEHAEAFI